MKLTKFFWYLFVASFYVMWGLFVGNILIEGLGRFMCNHFPALASWGEYRIGILSTLACIGLFISIAYLHTDVKDKYFMPDVEEETPEEQGDNREG
jgi:hypothetical protein